MAISFDKALGIHQQALAFRTQRAQVLANNLANAETPNFKARDISFSQYMNKAQATQSVNLNATRPDHFGFSEVNADAPELFFRTPNQPTIDGNTVDEAEELARFSQNAVDFQASFEFLSNKFKGLKNALRGEG